MKIRALSDLHLEFMSSTWSLFVESIEPEPDEQVLVLAGDIAVTEIEDVLAGFCAKWQHVVYVPGNHEYYGSHPSDVTERIARCCRKHANLVRLDRCVATLSGRRFLGASLWFPRARVNLAAGDPDPRCQMSDFFMIREFEPWVYDQNALALDWLEETVQPGDVVVTHHLPTHLSVHPKYAGDPLNVFFCGDKNMRLHQLMLNLEPAAWIHGHTHESFDYEVGATRVVCNPRGYYPRELNPNFDPGKSIDVG